MFIAFISTITETTNNAYLIKDILIDLSFYAVLGGVVGWALFGKEKKKVLNKTIFSLMIIAPLLFLLFQLKN